MRAGGSGGPAGCVPGRQGGVGPGACWNRQILQVSEIHPLGAFLTRLAQKPGMNCETAGAVSQAGGDCGVPWGAGVKGTGATQTGLSCRQFRSPAGGRIRVKQMSHRTLVCVMGSR